MNINITVMRGAVDIINFDSDFHRRLEEFVLTENADWKQSQLGKIHRSFRDLKLAVERVLPEETEKPFTIKIDIQGEADHSPGPRFY